MTCFSPGFIFPFVSSASVALTFVSYKNDGVQSSPHTFTGQNIGTASAGRYVVVCVGVSNASVPTACTVAGQSTTRVVAPTNTVDRSMAVFVTDAPVTSGTTADIVVTMGGTRDVEIAVFTLEGASNPTTPTTATDTEPSGLTININVSAGGACLGCAIDSADGGNLSWTGLTERQEGTSANYDSSYAGDNFATAQTPLTVTVTGHASNAVMGGVAWAP